jgi:hypothetical protein
MTGCTQKATDMKKVLILLAVVFAIASCQNADKKIPSLSDDQKRNALRDSSNYTTIEWLDSTSQDLGTVKEGKMVEVSYRFKNTGTHNLIIANASASCGCTKPEIPEEAIAPGSEGVIKAKFDSKGRRSLNEKQIFVNANTNPSNITLMFRVQVTE